MPSSTHSGLPFVPPQASTLAGPIDWVILAVTINAVVFTVGIFAAITYLAVKYRRGNKVDRSNPPLYNHTIEIVWTAIPFALVMALFVWSTWVFLAVRKMPANAMEVYVTGKQWMWKMQHPEGRWENNELHIPVGRPIMLTMTSTDVIHDFFVPAFRLHQDVVPGTYTRMWFTPTQVGTYPLYCAQFCGTFHSQMTGFVSVMEPADYQKWLQAGANQETMAAAGSRLFITHGCSGCHGANGNVRAPALEGIYGRPIPIQIPRADMPIEKVPATTIIVDDRYLHDSIVLPDKEVAAGYKPIMPTFKNRLTEADIFKLTAYIKSLANKERLVSGTAMPQTRTLTPEEYKARTGFVPANIKRITR